MVEKLTKLYNTLMIIETKGENTKTMADCLRYIERMVADAKTEAEAHNENTETEVE